MVLSFFELQIFFLHWSALGEVFHCDIASFNLEKKETQPKNKKKKKKKRKKTKQTNFCLPLDQKVFIISDIYFHCLSFRLLDETLNWGPESIDSVVRAFKTKHFLFLLKCTRILKETLFIVHLKS